MDAVRATFGAAELRALRKLRGLTQGELARLLGCTQARVSMMERDRVPIRRRDELKLAAAFYPERAGISGASEGATDG